MRRAIATARRRPGRAAGAAAGMVAAAALAACVSALPRREESRGEVWRDEGGPVVRVALSAKTSAATLSGSGGWRLYARDGRTMLVRAGGGDTWTVSRAPGGGGLHAVREDGEPTAVREGPFIARPDERGAFVMWNGKRYRGEIAVIPIAGGLAVVNRLPIEEYLRGVVPLEIGNRTADEIAAVEAQAVAARSYTFVRLRGGASRPYDLLSTVTDQVYGGADAERPVSDEAVRSTSGLVLTFAGRVVNAPYHSTCGGSTAEAPEVWRSNGEPYLQRVSDRVPGSDRFYCDAAPRFSWTRTLDAPALRDALSRYLREYASVSGRGIGTVQRVEIDERTPSGRVGRMAVVTDRGRYELRGNDIRFVMRPPGGEILNSTYFSVETTHARDGRLARLIFRGGGYGHGIGMCQWGAIGRARVGQSFREILRTYYPGTSVAPAEG